MIYVSNAFSLSSFAVACVSELLLHDRQGIRGQTVRGVLHSRTLMHTLQLIVFSSLTLSVASQQILDIVSFFFFLVFDDFSHKAYLVANDTGS